jgi:DNA invertase Pin-like site-specific DNA recombinase
MDTKKRAWLYCRIDAPEDTHGSLKGQKEKLDSYARQMGFDIVGASEDLAGGLNFDRAGLNEAMEAAKAGEMDVLVIHSISQIGRDMEKTIDCIRQLNNCGVKLYSPLDGEITIAQQNPICSQLFG